MKQRIQQITLLLVGIISLTMTKGEYVPVNVALSAGLKAQVSLGLNLVTGPPADDWAQAKVNGFIPGTTSETANDTDLYTTYFQLIFPIRSDLTSVQLINSHVFRRYVLDTASEYLTAYAGGVRGLGVVVHSQIDNGVINIRIIICFAKASNVTNFKNLIRNSKFFQWISNKLDLRAKGKAVGTATLPETTLVELKAKQDGNQIGNVVTLAPVTPGDSNSPGVHLRLQS